VRDHKWRAEGLFQGLHSIQRVASVCKVSSMPSSGVAVTPYSIVHTPYSQYAIIECEDTRFIPSPISIV
jgi:hypothetical protein